MNPTNDPSVDPARIDSLYMDLKSMQVELDADPLELGPKRLNEKISQCRGMLSRCETTFLSVAQDLHRYKRSLRSATADFKLQVRDLLTNDPEVRMGRNVTDREAIASTKLRAEAEAIDQLTACVEELETVLSIVRTKRSDLKDIQGRLRDQLKVCQEELTLGGRWGRALPVARKQQSDSAGDGVQHLVEDLLVGPEAEARLPRLVPAQDNPPIFTGGPEEVPSDTVLADIPEVDHPDSAVFTDGSIDDLLSGI